MNMDLWVGMDYLQKIIKLINIFKYFIIKMKMIKQLCVYCKSYTTCQYCIKYGRTIGKGIYQRNKYLDKKNQVTVKWLTDYYNRD